MLESAEAEHGQKGCLAVEEALARLGLDGQGCAELRRERVRLSALLTPALSPLPASTSFRRGRAEARGEGGRGKGAPPAAILRTPSRHGRWAVRAPIAIYVAGVPRCIRSFQGRRT